MKILACKNGSFVLVVLGFAQVIENQFGKITRILKLPKTSKNCENHGGDDDEAEA